MLSIEVKTNVAQVLQNLTELQRRKVPWATKQALDWTAADIAAAEQAEIRRVFKSPSDWTLDSVTFEPATYDNGSGKYPTRPAIVRFKEDHRRNSAGYYLRPHVQGNGRGHTPFETRMIAVGRISRAEYLVPAKYAERDARGDLVPGQIVRILTDMAAFDTAIRYPGYRDRGKRRGERYVVLRRSNGVPDGIYRVDGGRRLLCFLIVAQPRYARIYDFEGVARRVLDARFAMHFRRELAKAVAESKARHSDMRSAG